MPRTGSHTAKFSPRPPETITTTEWDNTVLFMNQEPLFQERELLEALPEHFAKHFELLKKLVDSHGPENLLIT